MSFYEELKTSLEEAVKIKEQKEVVVKVVEDSMKYYKKINGIPRHAFLFSKCGTRIIATEGMGSWICMHDAMKVADEADTEIQELKEDLELMKKQLTRMSHYVLIHNINKQ